MAETAIENKYSDKISDNMENYICILIYSKCYLYYEMTLCICGKLQGVG